LVYNGEVYNFRELRAALETSGDVFSTDGDTEVVLAAINHWGSEAFSRLNGMWALCWYDSELRRGVLCRDRFGVKPLFYALQGAALYFASELRALTHLGPWDRGIDSRAVTEHLSFGYIAHPRTIYRNARRLPPGHYLSFGPEGAADPVRYYTPLPRPSGGDYSAARTGLRRALADSVVARRVSDVPVGAFLSGGLDSSIIALELSKSIGRPVQTFSIGFRGQKSYDETHYARLAARSLGTQHREWRLTDDEVLRAIPRILDHLSEPVGDSSIVPTALLAQFARQYVTVALSGDGGDELFGGYWRYLGHRAIAAYARAPLALRRLLIEPFVSRLAASRPSGGGNRMRQLRKLLMAGGPQDDPMLSAWLPLSWTKERDSRPAGEVSSAVRAALARHITWSRIVPGELAASLLDPEEGRHCDSDMLAIAERCAAEGDGSDPLNAVMAFDVQHQLPADMLQKVDLASMMHSLEVRVPFLDYRVVELALGMPSAWKIDRGQQKRVLIDAYRGRLPDVILDRSKQGFEVPVGELFRGPLRQVFHDVVTEKRISSLGLLSYPAVEGLYAAHLSRRADHASLLWALLSLCWWKP
jgi:asparagine synthase (glutamine-hydrolysing)